MPLAAHNMILDIYRKTLNAVDPATAVVRHLSHDGCQITVAGTRYNLGTFDRTVIVGAGKATARMAAAAEQVLGDRLSDGLVVTKYGHMEHLRRVRQAEAGHPLPDDAGSAATREIMELLRNADERTLILCLLSGGGSALLVSPARGISLEDKQRTTDLLLRTGASIDELNAVRKHLSAVKGGRLAQIAYSATLLSLILSDVIGDRLDVIASGPTAPDSSTYADALAVLDRYGIRDAVPRSVADFLERGTRGLEQETVRASDPCFGRTRNIIIGSNRLALAAAKDAAQAMGIESVILTAELKGEAREAGRVLAMTARQIQAGLQHTERRLIMSGGETTVTVRGNGTGGRNQELALSFAIAAEGLPGVTLLSAGTDGSDGPTDAAGAVVDGMTVARAKAAGLAPQAFLDRNDSYSFFRRFDAETGGRSHLVTGPTGTNVMDLQILLVEAT